MSLKIKSKKGFTMTEVLITLAVLVILFAISIPLAAGMRSDLKMKALDSKAKEIYLATQDRLTNLFVSGEYDAFKGMVEAFDASESSEDINKSRKLGNTKTQPPSGYTEDDKWKNFYCITSDDDIYKEYLISDTTLQAVEGNFIIEFYPETADVYSVFYSEDHTTSEMLEIYDTWLYLARSREDRSGFAIGYYSGNSFSTQIIPSAFEPSVTVTNAEELYLTIECGGLLQFSTTLNNLTIKVTLSDEHDNTARLEYNGRDPEVDSSGDNIELNILLDSMRENYAFADIMPELNPGDNVTVKVEFVYSYLGKVIDTDTQSGKNTAVFNSLFANGTTEESIEVDRVRHLNNLSSDRFKGGEQVKSVKQTDDIDFDDLAWSAKEWCPTTENKVNPLTSFAPIDNYEMFSNRTAGGLLTFDGQGLEIRNFSVASSAAGTGLLSYAECNLEDIRIVDPVVAGKTNGTGALVGNMYGGKIENCGVYLATRSAGGVRYSADEMQASVAKHTVNGTQNVGGLAGWIGEGVEVSSSFAAINVNASSDNAGGLIGSISGGSVEKCYSSGDVASDGSCAGGLAGKIENGKVSGCYSTSDIDAESSGGFVGLNEAGAISDSISYGLVQNTANSAAFTSKKSAGTYKNCIYLTQNGYNNAFGNETRSGITGAAYSSLQKTNSDKSSYPYSGDLFGKAFPFELISDLKSHYGDWPEESRLDAAFIYFEKYVTVSGGIKYGYYGQGRQSDAEEDDASMTWTLDTLLSQEEIDKGGYTLTEDGYAVLTTYNVARMTYDLNSSSITGTMTRAEGRDANGNDIMQASVKSGTSYTGEFALIDHPESMQFKTASNDSFTVSGIYVFELPFELQELRTGTANFYNTLKITGYVNEKTDSVFEHTYHYCPHFARSVVSPDVRASEAGKIDPNDVYVRTARQLNALGRYHYYWNTTNSGRNEKFTFHQELDLDYRNYTKTYCGTDFNLMDTSQENEYRNRPIGQDGGEAYTQFRAIYYGNGFEIKDYCLEVYNLGAQEYKFKYSGLFGEIRDARIYDVHMVSTKGDSYVVSHYISTNGAGGVGALVGLIYNQGGHNSIVQNCSASGYTVKYQTDGTITNNIAVGGLVGMCTGELKNSSAVCKLVTADIANSGGYDVGVGGLVGSKKAGTLQNCYAGGEVSISVSSGGGSHTVGGVSGGNIHTWIDAATVTEDYSIKNCYSYVYAASSLPNTFYAVAPTSSNSCYVVPSGSKTPAAGGAAQITIAQLAGYKTSLPDALSSFGSADADNSYPWTEGFKGQAYPFPAVVKTGSYAGNDALSVYKGGDKFVHYGDWIDEAAEPEPEPEPASPTGKTGIIRIVKNSFWGHTWYNYETVTYDFETAEVTTGSSNVLTGVTDEGYYIYTDSSLEYGSDGWVLNMNGEEIDELGTWKSDGTYKYVAASVDVRGMTLAIVRKDADPEETLFTVKVSSRGGLSLQN